MTDDLPPGEGDEPLPGLGLAVVRLAADGLVTSYDVVARGLFGWTDENGVGTSFAEVVMEQPDRSAAESFPTALAGGRPWAGLVMPRADDVWASRHATFVPSTVGRSDGGIVLALEFDSALWPLLTGDLDGWLVLRGGRVSYASPHATRLLGSTGRGLQGLRVTTSAHAPADRLEDVLVRHLRGADHDHPIELHPVDATGQWIEAAVTGTNAEGPMAGVLWRLRDVTGRRRLDARERARTAELQHALETRVVIEQAKGFLAGRDGDSPEVAFRRLRRHARDHNLELREVARRLMTGDITLTDAS